MIVNDIGKMIGGKSVGLEENRVGINVFILPLDVAEELVVEFGGPFERNGETDYMGFSLVKVFLYVIRSEIPAVAVIALGHLVPGLDFPALFQTFCIAKTVVGMTFFNEFMSVFLVQFKPFRLDIGAVISPLVATFIPVNAEPGERIVEVPHILFTVPGAVGVFEPENEFSAL
jgi:hypothetical protein